MRRTIAVAALAAALLGGFALPVGAQDGIVIENNGVDSTHSAAGADNVNISRAAGNSSSVDGAGMNNEAGFVVKERNRDRKNREARNNDGGGGEVPAETVNAALAEGDYQAFNEAAPADPVLDPNLPVQLPNTGVAAASGLPLASIVAGLAATVFGAASLRRRLFN